MNDDPLPPLRPLPLAPDTLSRIRERTRREARLLRVAAAEAAVHGVFAAGALAWAFAAAFG
jgi:hypothetical protein